MRKEAIFLALFAAGLLWSGIEPKDQFTWALEVFPAVLGVIILAATHRRFRFSDMTYSWVLVHCYILFVGGHYTYAEVPLFDSIRDALHHSRNNYDKVGHFMQGFVPAMIARELFVRKGVVQPGVWLGALTVAVCLSVSACYEFLEWFVAVVSGESAEAFLGTQGDPWDTQSDMLLAMLGAIAMIVLLSRLQDKVIGRASRR